MTYTVSALFDSKRTANDALERLAAAGVAPGDVSVVADDGADVGRLAGETSPDATAAGAGGGALLGALLGAAVAVPGGPLVAGPLVPVLAGATAGAWSGGVLGALVDLGMPEDYVRLVIDHVGEGGVLVAADTRRPSDAHMIRDLLLEAGGPLAHNTLTIQEQQARMTLGGG